MSTLRVNGIQGTDGVERYLCRAWVNFNGTGTVAIRASGNVTSITDNGTGDYTVNFTSAMPDANYSVHVMNDQINNGGEPGWSGVFGTTTPPTASSCRIGVGKFPGSGANDRTFISVTIFR